MAISPERDAELEAMAKEIIRDLKGVASSKITTRPKVVAKEDQIIRDANVSVSKADKNFPASDDGMVQVRRPDYVTINIPLWEEQQEEKRRYKRYLRELDPCRLGLYGPIDDDED
jgi:hypothetical protein